MARTFKQSCIVALMAVLCCTTVRPRKEGNEKAKGKAQTQRPAAKTERTPAKAVPAAKAAGLSHKEAPARQIKAEKSTAAQSLSIGSIDSKIVEVAFCGEDYNNVLVLTKTGNVYYSSDFGGTWASKRAHFDSEDSKSKMEVIEMFQNPVDHGQLVFVDRHGEHLVTRNCGQSFRRLSQAHAIHSFQFHPSNADVILSLDADQNLYLSKDKGESWHKIASDIRQFAFAKYSDEAYLASKDRIFAIVANTTSLAPDPQLVYSDNYMNNTVAIAERTHGFRLTANFVYARQTDQSMRAFDAFGWFYFSRPVSIDQANYQATFVNILESELTYSTFATSSVQRNGFIIDQLLKSDYYGSSFKAVHDNIVCRSDLKACDFTPVHGLSGTILINAYDQGFIESYVEVPATRRHSLSDLVSHESLADFKQTLISSNFGEKFSRISAPRVDYRGGTIFCKEDCYLNLHLQSSMRSFQQPKSSSNMPGVIIALGCIGGYLVEEDPLGDSYLGLYITEDEGSSWRNIALGNYAFEFINNGSLLLFAEKGKPTNKLYYSFDLGRTVDEMPLGANLISVGSLSIKTNSKLKKCIVEGMNADLSQRDKRNIVYTLDMSNLYERQCVHDKANAQSSDYEEWTPKGSNGDNCLNGREVVVYRKRPDRKCYNPDEFVNYYVKSYCPCTEGDFHCDSGYTKDSQGSCVRNPETRFQEEAPPYFCKDFYYASSGYRKNFETGCSGGVEHPYRKVSCPSGEYFHFGPRLSAVLWFAVKAVFVLGMAALLWKIRGHLNVFRELQRALNRFLKFRRDKKANTNSYNEIQLSGYSAGSPSPRNRRKKDANTIFDDDDDEEEPQVQI